MTDPVVSTPITRVLWAEDLGNEFYMKREDLQPFSFGGNKVRIGWEFMRDLTEGGYDAMLIYGDARSNLCRILAGMCAVSGIPARMIATRPGGEKEGADISFNEMITAGFGVPVRTCEADRIADAVDEEMERFRSEGRNPYYIYGNRFGTGREGIAARAYASAYREILAQEKELGIRFDLIVVPYGTGATQGGLIAGAMDESDEDRILGISVSSRTDERARSVLLKTVSSYFADRASDGADVPGPEMIGARIHLETGRNCGGYGIVDGRVTQAVRDMFLQNSVALAPEYTGKAWRGMCDYLRENGIFGKRILFINTGGLPLFFDALRRTLKG